MLKIEKEMNAVVSGGYNWSDSNTCVKHSNGVARVYLHGNDIAYKENNKMFVVADTLRNWNTRTTRSRLYALGFNKKELDNMIASC